MKKILVAGASGGLGKRVLEKLKEQHYFTRALIKKSGDEEKVQEKSDELLVADASNAESLDHCCDNIDVVFSAIGKSVSLFSKNAQSFYEADYIANKNIIDKAKKGGVKRFVYISIYGSDIYSDFELAKVHRKVEKELLNSGMNYTIIRPVGLFVGLLDVLRMAKNGAVITVGDGENKTNPIHEDDLASVCAQHIEQGPAIVEAGGPEVLTRNQIAELAIKISGDDAQHVHLPELIVQGSLPVFNLYDKNFFDKLAFFTNVLTHDVVAPSFGSQKLEDYFRKNADHLEESWLDLLQ